MTSEGPNKRQHSAVVLQCGELPRSVPNSAFPLLLQPSIVLIRQAMWLTEESDRMSWCRACTTFNQLCMGTDLYHDLCMEHFPGFESAAFKRAVVGGGAYDGTWARYYRLLLRSDQCRAAVREYMQLTTAAERTAAMLGYDARDYNAELPIERFYRERAIALYIDRSEENPRYSPFAGPNRATKIATMGRTKHAFVGTSLLGWSRFFIALKFFGDNDLLLPFSRHDELIDVPDIINDTALGVVNLPIPLLFELLRIVYQADGPTTRNRSAFPLYDHPPGDRFVSPVWHSYLVSCLLRRPGTEMLEFAMRELGTYEEIFHQWMITNTLRSRRPDVALLMLRADRLLDEYAHAHGGNAAAATDNFRVGRWMSLATPRLYLIDPQMLLLIERLLPLYAFDKWAEFDAVLVEETARLASASASTATAQQ